MSKVVNLDDYREAYQIIGVSGIAYKVPETYLINLVKTNGAIDGASHDLIRGMIRELLIDFGVNPSEFGE